LLIDDRYHTKERGALDFINNYSYANTRRVLHIDYLLRHQ